MADNLIATISQFLTPDLRNKIAGALGLDPSVATKALGAAVPAILSSLGAVAATPGGASKLSDMISNQDMSMLDGLGAKLDSDGPMGMIESGTGALSSLVGGAGMSALSGAISKFSGTDSDTAGSVLGLMGPIVTGVIGQQDPNNWTSGAGIASMFAAQKSNIAAAMPAGLGSLLSAGGLAGAAAGVAGAASGLAGAARNQVSQGTAQVSQGVSNAAGAAQAAANQAKGGFPIWALILGAIVVALLAWYFLKKDDEKAAMKAPAPVATQSAAPAAPAAPAAAMPDVASAAKLASGTLGNLGAALGSISDAASAKAALPKLAEVNTNLDQLTALAQKVPADGKGALISAISSTLPALKGQADKVLALPGVGDVAKPALDAAFGKLDALTK